MDGSAGTVTWKVVKYNTLTGSGMAGLIALEVLNGAGFSQDDRILGDPRLPSAKDWRRVRGKPFLSEGVGRT